MAEMPDVDPAYHRNLFKITDELNRAHLDHRNLSAGEFTTLLSDLCQALRKSIANDIEQVLRAAAGLLNDPGLQAEASAVVKEARAFAKFIDFERQTLRDCGVSEVIANHMAHGVAQLRDQLSKPKIDPDRTLAVLKRFQDDVCIGAEHADENLSEKDKRFQLETNASIASGFAVSLANGTAAAASGGIFAYALLSVAAGGAMVHIASRRKGPRDRKLK